MFPFVLPRDIFDQNSFFVLNLSVCHECPGRSYQRRDFSQGTPRKRRFTEKWLKMCLIEVGVTLWLCVQSSTWQNLIVVQLTCHFCVRNKKCLLNIMKKYQRNLISLSRGKLSNRWEKNETTHFRIEPFKLEYMLYLFDCLLTLGDIDVVLGDFQKICVI